MLTHAFTLCASQFVSCAGATGLKEKKVCVDINVQAAESQICVQNICGQQRNSPIADPIFGSKYGPQNGELDLIFISFFRSLLGPRFGGEHKVDGFT